MDEAIVEKIIDLSAFKNNFDVIKKYLDGTMILSVLKADAYGHGMKELAIPSLENGASFLAVATTGEALVLRKYLDEQNIARPLYAQKPDKNNPRLLCWTYDPDTDLQEVILGDIDIAISNTKQLQQVICALEKVNLAEELSVSQKTEAMGGEFEKVFQKKAYVHIKVDTGMSRIGVQIQDLPHLIEEIKQHDNIVATGLFSHLACADELESDYTNYQRNIFEEAISICEDNNLHIPYKHLAASSGILFHSDTHYDMVRAGIIMYGLTPNIQIATGKQLGLKPVMSLETKVIQVKKFVAGTKISYGGTYTLDKDSYVAVVPFGYADGMPRILSNNIEVEINGKTYPQIGRICMDQFMVNLGDNLDNIAAGATVKIIGDLVTADDLAANAQTINYEIVTKINGRIKTVYLNK